MLVDSHCHLDFAEEAERPEIVARAKRAGVRTLLTISTKLDEFPTVRAIAETDPDIWCSVGVHPHEAAVEPAATKDWLVASTRHAKVVGIGETGLDFYYEHSPRLRQAEIFRVHIAAAREAQVPLIVHTRDADPETIAILEEEHPPAGVIHCFSTGRALAERAIKLGFYISLLVETDAPYLAPVPLRGKRNEPAFITHTATLVAELKGVTADELARATTANFFRLFAKARPPETA
jgi:TatD DNase family protein